MENTDPTNGVPTEELRTEELSVQEADNAIPQIRFQDQTPIPKSSSKRMRVSFSPDLQSASEANNSLNETIESTIEKVLESQIPKIVEKLETSLSAIFKSLINQGLQDIKESVLKETMETIEMETRKCNLKSVSEAELLEKYNRRDNVRIIGLPEVKGTADNGQRFFEDYNQSIEKVLSVASEMGAQVDKSDISIAHRLPGRNSKARPMIVRFCRRVSKVEILRKKKEFEPISIDELSQRFRRPNSPATQVFQPYETRRKIRIYLDKRREYFFQIQG